ncbi:hypothetical protein M8C21_010755 [Ambrosia artemisiifolia]|uniref:Uncharacterized protein n=1 Tax=Ambrosia artemisiifolia TaxID=4212 RepID=A0AAD5CCK8_AMBAR|nr:hypothetical protein M8C21_010755 [Ambrosia artemisiifolia]
MEDEQGRKPTPITAAEEFWSGIRADTERRRAAALADIAEGKGPCVQELGSASATTGRKAQVKGKRPCVVNPSSSSATTVMDETLDEDIRFLSELISSRYASTGKHSFGTKAPGSPKSPNYVDLSEYPPDTEIDYELHLEADGRRFVERVPRWAREKMQLMFQDPCDPEEDHSLATIKPEDIGSDGMHAVGGGQALGGNNNPNPPALVWVVSK